jgi:hypothetical protein
MKALYPLVTEIPKLIETRQITIKIPLAEPSQPMNALSFVKKEMVF